MSIRFIEPFSTAFGRMKSALFNPFDLKKWFIVGFTAFLAGLTDYNGGGGSDDNGGRSGGLEDVVNFPQEAWDWLNYNPGWFALIIVGLMFFIGLIFLLSWLSSRGEFMFLDNVVHDRAQVVKPWHEFSRIGNSLFFWRVSFAFICIAAVLLFIYMGYMVARNVYFGDYGGFTTAIMGIGLGLSFITFVIIAGFISMFLTDFIVPIMYKKGISAVEAWDTFIPLFREHMFSFIGYGIMIFILWIMIVISILIVGLFTCCIGFVFLIIPFIGTVTILPVHYTLRAFSVQFLEQFGPEFEVFPKKDDSSENIPVKQDE
ncbi:MAG: hypothetical protein GY863_20080 [bacterium]|nr:hypothetical protein [bacterium]